MTNDQWQKIQAVAARSPAVLSKSAERQLTPDFRGRHWSLVNGHCARSRALKFY